MFKTLLHTIYHDMLLTMRHAYSWITPLLFFVMVTCLFPFALGADQETLNTIAPGIIWVAVLLAVLISIGNLFRHDADEGFLDLLLLSPHPLTLLVLGKIISHWLTHCLPLILISPLIGFLLHLSPAKEVALIATLLIGTPILSLVGAIGSALLIGIRSSGLLLPILIMPFYIPVLIFGTGILMLAGTAPLIGHYALLTALLLFSLAFGPLLTGMALRIGVNH